MFIKQDTEPESLQTAFIREVQSWENGHFLMRKPRSDFSAVWLAQTVSTIGDNVSMVVVPFVLVEYLHAGKIGLSVVSAMQWLPFALLAFPIGSLVQRSDKRRLMIIADAARFGMFALLAVLLGTDRLNIWLVGAMIFVVGSFTVAHEVSSNTLVPDIVSRDELHRANALLQSTQTFARLVGPPFAGFVMVFSVATGFIVDAVSYLISGVCIASLKWRHRTPGPAELAETLHWADGMRAVWRLADLRAVVGVTAASNVSGTAMYITSLYFLVHAENVGSFRYGLLLSCGAVGGVVGGLLMARLRTVGENRARFAAIGLLLEGPPLAATIFLANSRSLIALGVALGLGGFGLSIYNVCSQTLRQELAVKMPNPAQIHASSKCITWGAVPVGMALGALFLQVAPSIGAACLWPALMAVALAVAVWVFGFGRPSVHRNVGRSAAHTNEID